MDPFSHLFTCQNADRAIEVHPGIGGQLSRIHQGPKQILGETASMETTAIVGAASAS
jgi:hypothetical protein